MKKEFEGVQKDAAWFEVPSQDLAKGIEWN
jgi:hypothetical protein